VWQTNFFVTDRNWAVTLGCGAELSYSLCFLGQFCNDSRKSLRALCASCYKFFLNPRVIWRCNYGFRVESDGSGFEDYIAHDAAESFENRW
jgi:hypothetical protein